MTAGVRAMAPSMIENPKKDFIMTKEEAQLLSKKKKGYAYVAVTELAPKTEEAVAEAQVKRTRHGGMRRPESPISGKQEDVVFAGKDARGLKRKAGREEMQEIQSQGDVVFVSGDNYGQGRDVGEKDKAWKREMRKRLKMELQEIESAKLKLSDKLMNGLTQGSGSTQGRVGPGRGGNGAHSSGAGFESGRWAAGSKQEVHQTIAQTVLGGHWDGGHGGYLNSLHVGDGTPGVVGREKRTPKTSTKLTDFMTGTEKKPVVVEKPKGKVGKGVGKKGGHGKQKRDQKRIQGSGLDECMRIINKLMAHQVAQVYFNAPVDPVALGIPDYFTIIKNPMDFLTIKQKLEGGAYGHPREFEDDVRLVFANCFTYNAPEHEAHKCGQFMLKIFERLWKPLGEMLANEGQEGAVDNWGAGGEVEFNEGDESKRKKQKVAGTQDMKGGLLKGTKPAGGGKQEMSFDEKRKLSVNLGKLPSEKLGRIVAIISERNPDFGGNGDEIELDIDSLDDDTLWQLQRYVANCMKSKSKDKRREEQREVAAEPSAAQKRSAQEGQNEDEDIDIIAADDGPGNTLPVPAAVSESTSGSSSGESSSSESDSDSGSSSGSESEQDVQSADAGSGTPAHPPDKVNAREGGASGAGRGPTGTSAPQPDSGKRVSDGDATSSLKEIDIEHASPEPAAPAPMEETRKSSSPVQEPTPEEDLRRKELMGKFASVIAKANVEVELAAKQAQGANAKADPDKARRDREEKERLERLERERLKREAAKAEEARKKALVEAQAEKQRKIEAERQAHRQKLQEMEKTVEIDGSMEALKEIELLRNTSFPAQEHPPSSGEPSSPSSSDGPEIEAELEGNTGGFTLEKLGLFMKDDEEDDEEEDDDVEVELQEEGQGVAAVHEVEKMQPEQGTEELEEGEV